MLAQFLPAAPYNFRVVSFKPLQYWVQGLGIQSAVHAPIAVATEETNARVFALAKVLLDRFLCRCQLLIERPKFVAIFFVEFLRSRSRLNYRFYDCASGEPCHEEK